VELQNWAGNITFSTPQLQEPRTVEQLQDVIAGAARVRALGTGHSFNRIADTTGTLVSVRRLASPIEVDEPAGTVTVPAGARYGEVAVALEEHGLALENLGSLPHISLAGACATGTHGSGDGNRCLAAAAVAVEFVRADGEVVRVDSADDDFGGSVLALGALGVVTRMTLAVRPSFRLRQDVWLDAPLESALQHYDEIMSSGYSVSMFSDPGSPGVMNKIWIKSDPAAAPADGSRWSARPAAVPQHPITGQDARAATEQLGVAAAWHERLPHFRLAFTPSSGDEQQTEYLLPREHAPDAISAVLGLHLDHVLQVAEFRTVAADDLWLSPCHDRATAAVHFTWNDDDAAVSDAIAQVERALAPYDARPHWGKVFRADPGRVRPHYPRLADFQALAARHDPDRRFGNEFLERYVY
jgi:alditol oxidase